MTRFYFWQGHRVLLFSQFVIALDIIEEFLKIRKFQFVRFDGSTKGCERFVYFFIHRSGCKKILLLYLQKVKNILNIPETIPDLKFMFIKVLLC